jgi:hypothetical protein
MTDLINHPPHYVAANGLETIDVIERYGLDFHLGNAIKYLLRADRKGDALSDLKKARWYLVRWAELLAAHMVEEPTADETTLEWQTPDTICQAFGLKGLVAAAAEHVLDVAVFSFVDYTPAEMIADAIKCLDAEIAGLIADALPVPHRVSA